ncbi:MAG: cyclase family protein [Lachnospiraceae bacterium]|nr:cyclase family protein [Lachnospiraceae bacterium]
MKVLDLTFTYKAGMTGMSKWHPVVTFEKFATIPEVGMNTSSLLLGSHIATHMDAAKHFYDDMYTIDQTPLEKCIGDVTIVDLRDKPERSEITAADLAKYELKERILLLTGWSRYFRTDTQRYNTQYPFLSLEAAQYCPDHGVKLIAMDIPSPDQPASMAPPERKFEIHHLMLKNEVIFVEALAHTDLIDPAKTYEFIALPLKLEGLDASPCRVVLLEKED